MPHFIFYRHLFFKYIPKDVASDFGKDIFPRVILKENLYGYKTTEYIKDMGTPLIDLKK